MQPQVFDFAFLGGSESTMLALTRFVALTQARPPVLGPFFKFVTAESMKVAIEVRRLRAESQKRSDSLLTWKICVPVDC